MGVNPVTGEPICDEGTPDADLRYDHDRPRRTSRRLPPEADHDYRSSSRLLWHEDDTLDREELEDERAERGRSA